MAEKQETPKRNCFNGKFRAPWGFVNTLSELNDPEKIRAHNELLARIEKNNDDECEAEIQQDFEDWKLCKNWSFGKIS